METENIPDDRWVIRKGSYFYRPNAQGYTSNLYDAGVWPHEEAKKHINTDPCGPVTIHRYSAFETRVISGSNDDVVFRLRARVAALEAAVVEISRCFDAAYTEGLADILPEADERMRDLMHRRILPAHAVADAVLFGTEEEKQ